MAQSEDEKKKAALRKLGGESLVELVEMSKRLEKERAEKMKLTRANGRSTGRGYPYAPIATGEKTFFQRWPEDQKEDGEGSSMKRLGDNQRKSRTLMYGLKAGSPRDNSPRPGSAIAKVEFPKSKKPDDKITKSEFTTMLESLTGILKELLGKLDKLRPEIEALEQKRLGKKNYPSIRDLFLSKN